MGNALALNHNDFSFIIFLLSILTAIAFQIVSNFSNDYGDGINLKEIRPNNADPSKKDKNKKIS